jgi:hypothetical protein
MASAGRGRRGQKGSASGARAHSRPAPAQAEAVLRVNPVNQLSMAKLEVEAARIRETDQIAFGADSLLRLRGICGASFIPAEYSQHGGLPEQHGGLPERAWPPAATCRNNS